MTQPNYPANDPNPFAEPEKPKPSPSGHYGLPMFVAAWIGAVAQDLGRTFPTYGFILFLAAVVLILFFARAFDRS